MSDDAGASLDCEFAEMSGNVFVDKIMDSYR